MRFVSFVLCLVFISFKCNAQQQAIKLLHAKRGHNNGIYDPDERHIILRGANYNVLGEYWQGVPDAVQTKTYDEQDLKLMAEQGFNCIRLIFSWSRLEPVRGKYDTAYIKQIATCIEAAARYNIYVMLDMHQDAWGMYVPFPHTETCARVPKEWDGAPQWATITNGVTGCVAQHNRESSPAVVRSFENFWQDKDTIQEACINAWKVLIKATAHYNNVLGYDLLNEPNLGEKGLIKESRLAGKYFNKLIAGIRSAEHEKMLPGHIIFFEASITWRGKEIPSIPFTSFPHEKNIVFSPHHYFESLGNWLTIEKGYKLFRFITGLYHTEMLIGEWGFFTGAKDTAKLKRFAAGEDKLMLGDTWWQWCAGCGDPHALSRRDNAWKAPDKSMHLIELDRQGHFTGKMNEPFLHILNRPHPLAVPGKKAPFKSDPDNGSLFMKGRTKKAGIVELWIPGRFGKPVVSGKNVLDNTLIDYHGGYKCEVRVAGKYEVLVGH